MADPFIGEIRICGFNFAPRGWAFCNGQLLPIVQNSALFSLLGTTYGGDGQTTFGLPNLQGRVPIHFGQGDGLSPHDLGEVGGENVVTLVNENIPNHAHTSMTIGAFDGVGTTTDPTGNYLASSPLAGTMTAKTFNTTSNTNMIVAGKVAQAHNNMQPYLVLNFIIALL
jgi:microcystin-dependent protein